MSDIAAAVIILVFVGLSLVHFYWALGGGAGKLAAVPEVSGRRVFVPSSSGTFIVAFGLALCALLVAATAALVHLPVVPATWLKWLSYVLATALLARAIGDFRLVGFFKRVRGTRFARLDSIAYAPLCLLLSMGVFYVANIHGA